MNPVTVMVTVSNRVKYLNAFLLTYATYGPGYPIHIHLQDPERRRGEIVVPKGVDVSWQMSDTPIGCHAARVLALRHLAGQGFDSYVNVDDDVLLTEHTRWQPAVGYAHHLGVGFVLTAWSRSASLYYKRLAQGLSHAVGPRVLVYNGGGMAYGEQVADLMRGLDPCPARYDDIWPLTAYVSGRMNYVYWGSQTVHNTVSKGGMKKYMADEPRPLLCWAWVDYPLLAGARVGSEYAIGTDRDIKPLAHQLHRDARAAAGWPVTERGRAVTPPLAPLEDADDAIVAAARD